VELAPNLVRVKKEQGRAANQGVEAAPFGIARLAQSLPLRQRRREAAFLFTRTRWSLFQTLFV